MAKEPAYRALVEFDAQAFGRRLAAARARAGMKPKQIAAVLDVSTETINRWERGGLERPPAKGQRRLLADLLDEPGLLLGDGARPPDAPRPVDVDPGEGWNALAQRLRMVGEEIAEAVTRSAAEARQVLEEATAELRAARLARPEADEADRPPAPPPDVLPDELP